MAAVDQVCSRVRTGMGQIDLFLLGTVDQLVPAPVEHADNVIRPLVFQLGHGLDGLVRVRLKIVVGSVDAKFDAVFALHDLGLIFNAVGQAHGLKRGAGVVHTGLIEVVAVVVGGGHKVHAALGQDVGIIAAGDKIEHGHGVIVGQVPVGEGALQVGDGEFIAFKILHGVGERIGKIPVHLVDKVGGVGAGAQSAVANGGKGEILRFRLRLGNRLRRGLRFRRSLGLLGLLLGSLVRGVYRVHIQGYPLKYDIKHGAEQKQHAENA